MRQNRCITLTVALTALIISGADADGPSVDPTRAVARVEHGLIPGVPVAGQMGRPLEERMTLYDVPAVSVAVIENFDVAWASAWGLADRSTNRPATTATLFQAASLSKPVTALAVHRLSKAGLLSLDTSVNEVLKTWRLPENELTENAPVTFRMLLSHTGGTSVRGFPGYEPDAALPTLFQVLDGTAPANTPAVLVETTPGQKLRYSGGGYTVIQQALVDLLGKPFPEIMDELVLHPTGMSSSTFDQPLPDGRALEASVAWSASPSFTGRSHVYPEMAAAGLWTTPTDLARFLVEIQRALRGDEDALISKETAEAMITPVMGPATPGFFLRSRDGEVYLQFAGANRGFRCAMMAHLDHGYGAVVMTNSDSGDALMKEVMRAVAKTSAWKGYLPEEIRPVSLSNAELDALSGRYRIGPDQVATLTRGEGVLLHREVLGGGVIPLYPVGGHTFRYAERYREPVTFVRGTDDRITGIKVEGRDLVWERLADDHVLPSELIAAGRIDEAIAAYRALEDVDEDRINNIAYDLLDDPARIDDAIALFALNTQLFPDSANTWDSLGEGCIAAGRTEQASASYRRSLELDPANTHAQQMLEELSRSRTQ
jgi:CubicO group peptidase (beta-lactamase class C family)